QLAADRRPSRRPFGARSRLVLLPARQQAPDRVRDGGRDHPFLPKTGRRSRERRHRHRVPVALRAGLNARTLQGTETAVKAIVAPSGPLDQACSTPGVTTMSPTLRHVLASSRTISTDPATTTPIPITKS